MYMNVWHTIGKKQVTHKTRGVCDEDSLVETKTGSKLFCYFWIYMYMNVWHTIGKKQITCKTSVSDEGSLVKRLSEKDKRVARSK